MKLTKEEALERGALRYNATAPCPQGHYGYRYTDNDRCTQCATSVRPDTAPATRSKLRRYKNLGIKKHVILCHPDDVVMIKHLIKTLNDSREVNRFRDVRSATGVKLCKVKS